MIRPCLLVSFFGLGLALGSLSGCSRAIDLLQSRGDAVDAGASARASGADAPGAPLAAAPAFTGVLTEARVLGATGLAKPFEDWDQAKAKLEAQLGAPTRVSGKWHEWAVDRDGTCAYVKVEQQATSTTTLTFGSVDTASNPNAKGPPAPVRTVSVKEVRDAVAKGQWVGGPVKMQGFAVNTTTMTSGSQRSVSLSIAQAKGGVGSTVGCVLGDVPDPSPKQWAPVEVTGTLESTFGGRIESCKIVD